MPRIWAVVGATGTGKSAASLLLADAIAKRGRAAEIVNADAMQVYRGMDIGTAKLSQAERAGRPHHLFDVLDVTEDATAAWYQQQARACITAILERGADAILVGGSGLYISAALYDFRFPPFDQALRAELEEALAAEGPGAMYQRLQQRDPAAAARIDPHNGRRIVRALEVLEQGEQTHQGILPEQPTPWRAATLLGLAVPREELVPRLDARVEQMWRDGFLAEIERLRDAGIESGTTAQRAIGYAQALRQLRGELDQAEAIAQTQALTRRYARRQVSWFRRDQSIRWYHPAALDLDEIALRAATPEAGER